MKFTPILLLLSGYWAGSASAGEVLDRYSAEAARASPGFTPSAARGQALFARNWTASASLPRCTTCHGGDPRLPGKHAITGKTIKAMHPAVEPARLSDLAKTEKWFRRNCREVVGRECSAGEKADVVTYLMRGTQS
jgi:cytochrome c553